MSDPRRTYRVIGLAMYIDRAGTWRRITVNRVTESPDAQTAEVLMLADVDRHVRADVDYDPRARWVDVPVVQDETPRRTALAACGFVVGSQVLRKSGADARVGIVRHLNTIEKRTRAGAVWMVRADVDWPAPRRLNGDGWHRSHILTSSLVPATTEERDRRRAINQATRAATDAHAKLRLQRISSGSDEEKCTA